MQYGEEVLRRELASTQQQLAQATREMSGCTSTFRSLQSGDEVAYEDVSRKLAELAEACRRTGVNAILVRELVHLIHDKAAVACRMDARMRQFKSEHAAFLRAIKDLESREAALQQLLKMVHTRPAA